LALRRRAVEGQLPATAMALKDVPEIATLRGKKIRLKSTGAEFLMPKMQKWTVGDNGLDHGTRVRINQIEGRAMMDRIKVRRPTHGLCKLVLPHKLR
jgi:hypothetical protein